MKGSGSVQIIPDPNPGDPKTYGPYGSGTLVTSLLHEEQESQSRSEALTMNNFCCLSPRYRTCFTDETDALVPRQDIHELLLVVPHRQLDPLPEPWCKCVRR
jgi:hypothetical protein